MEAAKNERAEGGASAAFKIEPILSAVQLPDNVEGAKSQALSLEVQNWLDLHTRHILPGTGGVFAWTADPPRTWHWCEGPAIRLSALAAQGAMYSTNMRFASEPLPVTEEGRDRRRLAPKKWGHLTVDLDGPEALSDLRKFLFDVVPSWGLKPEQIAVFLSGGKGFHAIVYDALLGTEDGDELLPLAYKTILLELKEALPTVDASLACMGRGKQFRLPQVKRPNGLHKIPLRLDEVREGGLTMEQMQELAKAPRLIPLPAVESSPEVCPIRRRMVEIRRQAWSDADRPIPSPMTDESREALAANLPACMVRLLGMEDYTGGHNLDFDKMCAALVAPFAQEVGLTVEDAEEIFGGWAVGFLGSQKYSDPFDRLDVLRAKLHRKGLAWRCSVAHGMLPSFDCSECPQRIREVAALFPPLGFDVIDEGPAVRAPLGRGFRFLRANDLLAVPRVPNWLIRGYLEANNLLVLFGESGSMKSFVALDLSLCVATGLSWHGHAIPSPGPVFYIAGEGFHGIGKRIKAWTVAHGVGGDMPLFVSNEAAQFLDANHAREVADAVGAMATEHGAPRLIVVDTLNRCFGPGDENSSSDMTAFVTALDRLRERFACTVMVVHHSGLTATNRSRGSSVLRAAADVEYRLDAKEATRTLVCTKSKDHEPPQNMAFVPKDVGTGWRDPEDGAEVKSCILEQVDTVKCVSDINRLPAAQQVAMDALVAVCTVSGGPCHVTLWRAEAYKKGISTGGDDARQKAFKRASEALGSLGLIRGTVDLWEPVG